MNPQHVAPLTAGLPPRLAWLKNIPFLALHAACFAAIWTGITWTSVLLCGFTYFIRMFGITAGYHRYFAHRSYKTSRFFQFVMAFLGCSAMQKGPLWWAAHHRHHHLYSDTPNDPHSPKGKPGWWSALSGFWWSHVGWVLDPRTENTEWDVIQDMSRFPELRFINKYHWVPGIVLAVACYLIDGWCGLVWGFVISTVLLYHGVFTVNSLCHIFGRRRFTTTDDSRNNWLVALITLGEGWHNNHHYYQSSANQGFYWWEVDVSFYLLKALERVGIVWKVRTPPAKRLVTNRITRPKKRKRTRRALVGAGQGSR